MEENYQLVTDPNYVIQDGDLYIMGGDVIKRPAQASVGKTLRMAERIWDNFQIYTKITKPPEESKNQLLFPIEENNGLPDGYLLLDEKYFSTYKMNKNDLIFYGNRWCKLDGSDNLFWNGYKPAQIKNSYPKTRVATKGQKPYPYGY